LNRTHDDHSSRGPQPIIYWLRWLLVLPAMGAAFVGAGAIGAIPCFILRSEACLFAVGPLCALAWVLTAFAMAPSHKLRTALAAFLAGALATWFMSRLGELPAGHRLVIVVLTCSGGAAALAVCLLVQRRLSPPGPPARSAIEPLLRLFTKGTTAMKETPAVRRLVPTRGAVLTLLLLAAIGYGAWMLARGVIDIVPQERRGLYLRLGRYVRTVEPGLHLKLPLIDSIIGVSVQERQGYIQHVDAMTQDNVIMKVSLQYTYEVTDPKRYRLEVEDPDPIIREFVQGKLRDIVNTISMNDVMKKRLELGQRITQDLAQKEHDFGIHFKLVQVQGAFPPPEVQEAIKQRMVSEQRTVAAKEEATQKQILADAEFYQAGKQAEAARFQIQETAKAQKESIRMLLEELSKHESLGSAYLQYLTAQELKGNSKWIISGGSAPQLHLDAQVADAD